MKMQFFDGMQKEMFGHKLTFWFIDEARGSDHEYLVDFEGSGGNYLTIIDDRDSETEIKEKIRYEMKIRGMSADEEE